MASNFVFEVSFKCNNCGNTWNKQFRKGTIVKSEGIFYPKIVIYPASTPIFCPNCAASDIQVVSRIPIKDKLSTMTPPE